MQKKSQKLKKLKMQKRVTEIEGGRYLIYYSFINKVNKKKDKEKTEGE